MTGELRTNQISCLCLSVCLFVCLSLSFCLSLSVCLSVCLGLGTVLRAGARDGVGTSTGGLSLLCGRGLGTGHSTTAKHELHQ